MLRFTTGNLLHADAEALVNTVNEVGVMGKGIALQFRDAFPHNTRVYQDAAKEKRIKVGRVLVTTNPETIGPRWIINFPTKRHWRQQSRLEWIRSGLQDLVRVVQELGIRSIAIPPLGAGAGKLNWSEVRKEIEAALTGLSDVDVIVFEPSSEYVSPPKQSGVEKLTPARALIADLVRRYEIMGMDCTILEVQKLAWFLHRAIKLLRLPDALKLKFRANKFGPYDDRLRHLLDALDGSFLHSTKRLSDAGPFDLIRFEYSRQDALSKYLESEPARSYLPALEYTALLIEGFESPFGMELLATVDWLLIEQQVEPDIQLVAAALHKWPGGDDAVTRKVSLFNERHLHLALDRLTDPPPLNAATDLFAMVR